MIESFTTARAYGVEDAVLASLQRDLSRHRLGEAGRLLLPARDRARPPPHRGDARGGGDRARGRPRAVVRGRHRRAPGLGRRPGRRRPVRRTARERASRRSADWRIEADRILDHLKTSKEALNDADASRRPPAGSTGTPRPSKPRFQLPPGAVDAHCHVFGPGAQFPVRARAQVHALRRAARSSCSRCATTWASTRNVIVQATCHGADNRALVDALPASGGKRARRRHGQAQTSPTPSCDELHDAGVRGVRFNFVKRLVDFTPTDELLEIAGRIAPLGWHVVDLFRGAGPARAVGLLHRAADHRGRRSHGPARRDASRSTAPSSSCS